jgi:hypothetical protein
MTSRASGFRHKYGVAAAGAIGKSLIARLPPRDFGPVVGVSYRVASRIANALRAGHPAREPAELNAPRTILFHAPPDQVLGLMQVLISTEIDWSGKALVICDCAVEPDLLLDFSIRGASIASARHLGIPGYLALQGTGLALAAANRIARDLRLKTIEIPPGLENCFNAAVTLSTQAFTPLLDRVAALLRHAGARESEAPRLAAALFQTTAADYIHSGKQSWGWYVQPPDACQIETEIEAAERYSGPGLAQVLRGLVLMGLDVYEKHENVAKALTPLSGESRS